MTGPCVHCGVETYLADNGVRMHVDTEGTKEILRSDGVTWVRRKGYRYCGDPEFPRSVSGATMATAPGA